MSGGYQRVMRIVQDRASSSGDQLLRDDEHGPLKVVPADAIVIERGDLPEVRPAGEGLVSIEGHDKETWVGPGTTAAAIRSTALRNLALAEYLDAHPPVDEALVDQLAEDLKAHLFDGDNTTWSRSARRLVEQGWTKPVQP